MTLWLPPIFGQIWPRPFDWICTLLFAVPFLFGLAFRNPFGALRGSLAQGIIVHFLGLDYQLWERWIKLITLAFNDQFQILVWNNEFRLIEIDLALSGGENCIQQAWDYLSASNLGHKMQKSPEHSVFQELLSNLCFWQHLTISEMRFISHSNSLFF